MEFDRFLSSVAERDNPETAREEFELIENEKDRGLFAECLFNVEEDICAKF